MIRKLHIQLTALCTAITGAVLVILTMICLFISESDIRHQESASFRSNLNTLYQNLELQTSISHNWIRQMEYHYQFSIRIFDNGVPLFFQSLEPNEELDTLTGQVIDTAFKQYGINVKASGTVLKNSVQEEFTIQDQASNSFNVSAALLARSDGTIGVVIIHALTWIEARVWHQRISFLIADVTALLLLGVFFWYFTAQMIKPLQENRRKQTEFIAAASHELRSPLTVILSNTAAVRNGIMPNDEQFLNVIDSEGTRMSRLIGDMLQLASADNHTWSIQPARIELDTLLLQTWESFESLATSRELHWNIRLPDEPVPPILCDVERLRQLLAILIDNAFTYTPKGGNVCLSLQYKEKAARTRSDSISIHISDNGPGIPDAQKKAVFERFYRADSSRRDKSHYGLGLCIAQEIVHLHHGQIAVTDTPGGGATFTVTLPML